MKFVELYCEKENLTALINLARAEHILSRQIPENDENVLEEYQGYKHSIQISFNDGRAILTFKNTDVYLEQIKKIKEAVQCD